MEEEEEEEEENLEEKAIVRSAPDGSDKKLINDNFTLMVSSQANGKQTKSAGSS